MPARQNSINRLPDRRRERPKAHRRGSWPPGGGTGKLPRYLTQAELAQFRKAVQGAGSARDLALFGLMYRFGLRAVEATLLLVENLDLGRGRIQVRRAKAGDPKE